MPGIDNYTKIRHLYSRAGFGLSASELNDLSHNSLSSIVKNLFKQSLPIDTLKVVDSNTLDQDIPGKSPEELKMMKEDLRKESREKIKALNAQWLNKMINTKAALREKMTLFWHGHFACENGNAFYVQNQINTLRTFALGKFGDLLMAVSKDPSMLAYLNNRQNKKNSPNENFAREVMELFTLGRGNYTEHDIKNAAKAFTGWNFKTDGSFVINQKQHDDGEKIFFEKTGNFSGEDILTMVLQNKKTALFLTRKIYSYFVNDNPNEKIVKQLADGFYNSGYDIGKLMEEIFKSDWFYYPENIGKRIKNPIELLVELQKTFGLKFEKEQSQLFIQKALGQVLFYPPNVAGWKEGKNWIDSSSLMFRLRLPDLIFKSAEINIQVKHDGDVNTEFLSKGAGKNFNVTADWQSFTSQFDNVKENDLLDALINYLLAYKLTKTQKELLSTKMVKTSKESMIKSLAIAITELPEYQMC